MNCIYDNTLAAVTLCSGLIKADVKPLGFSTWHKIIEALYNSGIEDPAGLFKMRIDEIAALSGVSNDMAARMYGLLIKKGEVYDKICDLTKLGIDIIPMDSDFYPERILQQLLKKAPPVFFCAGNKELINRRSISAVGSRNVSEKGKLFAQRVGRKAAADGYVLVSGGANGCDTIAEYNATFGGGNAVLYLAVPLVDRMKRERMSQLISEGRICLMSDYNPFGSFSSGGAIYRNQYIYSASERTYVCESGAGSGGTYNGAMRCIEDGYGTVFVYKNEDCLGNMMLIKNGAIAVE